MGCLLKVINICIGTAIPGMAGAAVLVFICKLRGLNFHGGGQVIGFGRSGLAHLAYIGDMHTVFPSGSNIACHPLWGIHSLHAKCIEHDRSTLCEPWMSVFCCPNVYHGANSTLAVIKEFNLLSS